MDDDDPFAVVAPAEKKMSTYLKKSKDTSSKKCVETSSHGTNSTRSTTASTLPADDINFFSSKTSDQSSKNKSSKGGFNNSSSSGSADFEFGNGLEFGRGFSESAFGDDGFGTSDQHFGGSERKAQSSRILGSTPDPFVPQAAPKSMRNLSNNNKHEFDAFGTNEFDAFGSNDFDDFGSSDPFSSKDDGFGNFSNDDDFMFGDAGFGEDAFDAIPSESAAEEAWQKREDWKKGARSRSGDVPKRSSSLRRKGVGPRRTHSTSGASLASSDDGSSPRAGSRKKPTSSRLIDVEAVGSPQSSQKSRDKSPRRGDDHSPVRRTRSGTRPSRRSTMDHSGHTETSETKSHGSDSQNRPRSSRRSSVTYTSSDGSLEPAVLTRIPPARNNSSSGPAHRPGGVRKQRRASSTHGASTDFSFMQMNLPSKEDNNDDKDEEWEQERSKTQEKIMGMYRGGGLSTKSENKTNDSSLDDISKHIDLMGLVDDQAHSSGDLGASRGRLRRGRKKETEKEEDEYQEPKDRKDRTKGSLLDRVAGDSSSKDGKSTSSRDSVQSTSGLSYSDRIMLAQQMSSKRN